MPRLPALSSSHDHPHTRPVCVARSHGVGSPALAGANDPDCHDIVYAELQGKAANVLGHSPVRPLEGAAVFVGEIPFTMQAFPATDGINHMIDPPLTRPTDPYRNQGY